MASTSQTKNASAFDVSKYTVTGDANTQTVIVEETGDTFEVSVKTLSWAKRNQLISQHMTWDAEGNTKFNASEYVRACLCDMIIDAPWGKTTEAFLISIDSRLGKALETLVPEAFDAEIASVDTVKNE